MKKRFLFTFVITTFLTLSCAFVFAQGGISGDAICGGSSTARCKLADLQKVFSRGLVLIVSIGFPVLVLFIAYRFVLAYFALQEGNASAYKEALERSVQAIIGFLIVVTVFGGLFLAVLKYFGVQDFPLKILEVLKTTSFLHEFIPHAYAQGSSIPSGLKATSLYDALISLVKTAIMFFIYPALIVIWVWTGFSFVAAQGKPDGLTKAKTLLVRALITTLVIFMIQGFLLAIQGTVKNILSTNEGVVEKVLPRAS